MSEDVGRRLKQIKKLLLFSPQKLLGKCGQNQAAEAGYGAKHTTLIFLFSG